jgi:hypothetical protein
VENPIIHDLVDAQRGMLGLLTQYQTAFACLHSWQGHVQSLLNTLVTALVENESTDSPRPALDTAALDRAQREVEELKRIFERQPPEPEA